MAGSSNPYTLIVSFCLILISGEHLGGFYALYLLLALYYAGIHALLGLGGIIVLIATRKTRNKIKEPAWPNILNIVGAALLILSLIWFFYWDKDGYNYGTFYQFVPRLSLILFGLIALLFIGRNLYQVFNGKKINTGVAF